MYERAMSGLCVFIFILEAAAHSTDINLRESESAMYFWLDFKANSQFGSNILQCRRRGTPCNRETIYEAVNSVSPAAQ